MKNNNNKKNTTNILSISSGGTKGLLILKILKEYSHDRNLKSDDFLNNFDLLIGTSAGSIIIYSLLLGYKFHEIYDFMKMVIKVLLKSKFGIMGYINTLVLKSYIYDINNLKNLMIEHMKKSPLYNKFKNGDFKKIKGLENIDELTFDNFKLNILKLVYPKKTFAFTTYNIDKKSPIIFTTTDKMNENPFFNNINKVKVIDIILMSSAAPLYFNKIMYNGDIFTDGVIGGLHNPSYLGLLISKNINKDKKQRILNIDLINTDKVVYSMSSLLQLTSNNTNLNKLLFSLTNNVIIKNLDILDTTNCSSFTNEILFKIDDFEIDKETYNIIDYFF